MEKQTLAADRALNATERDQLARGVAKAVTCVRCGLITGVIAARWFDPARFIKHLCHACNWAVQFEEAQTKESYGPRREQKRVEFAGVLTEGE